MTDYNPYVKALWTDTEHTAVAAMFDTSEAKVRRDRKKLGTAAIITPPEAFTDGEVKVAPRILTIDIESRPHTVYSWGLFKQFIGINQIVEPGRMICFAAKWLGESETHFYSEYKDGTVKMLEAAHSLLSNADVVVTYNGDRYDIKRLNNEFYTAGMSPPKPFKSIDLFKQNKGRFDFPSRKLDYLAQVSGVGNKAETGGFDLWLRCMAGEAEAWQTMEDYNRQDVALTEQVYLKMQPWLTNIPHLGMFTGDAFSCPNCGGTDLSWDGYTHAFVQSYMAYKCNDCGAWARGSTPKGEKLATRAAR